MDPADQTAPVGLGPQYLSVRLQIFKWTTNHKFCDYAL